MKKSLLRITLGSIAVATFLTTVSSCIDAESNLKEDIAEIETQIENETETNTENTPILIGRNSYKTETETNTIITTISELTSETTTQSNEELLNIINSTSQEGWCYTEDDLMLLAKVIDLEASDVCTDEHKLWVGGVVLNRIKSSIYPDTLKEVIYQRRQYGCIDKIPTCVPSERSINAARMLLNGEWNEVPSNVLSQSEFIFGKIAKQFDVYVDGKLYSTTYCCVIGE